MCSWMTGRGDTTTILAAHTLPAYKMKKKPLRSFDIDQYSPKPMASLKVTRKSALANAKPFPNLKYVISQNKSPSHFSLLHSCQIAVGETRMATFEMIDVNDYVNYSTITFLF